MNKLKTEEPWAHCGISFEELNTIAKNAAKSIKKTYSFLGSYTFEDLVSTAWSGIMSAISQKRFVTVKNKKAYCFSFAKGYCQHALQRKSRIVRMPPSTWNDQPSAHLSYSWENLPEAAAQSPIEQNYSDKLLNLASIISDSDYKKLMAGNRNISKAGKKIVEQILRQGPDPLS